MRINKKIKDETRYKSDNKLFLSFFYFFWIIMSVIISVLIITYSFEDVIGFLFIIMIIISNILLIDLILFRFFFSYTIITEKGLIHKKYKVKLFKWEEITNVNLIYQSVKGKVDRITINSNDKKIIIEFEFKLETGKKFASELINNLENNQITYS
jgi:hypothetical protein